MGMTFNQMNRRRNQPWGFAPDVPRFYTELTARKHLRIPGADLWSWRRF